MIVYVNGKYLPSQKALVSIMDHGFLYGDGAYETIRVYAGKPFLLEKHLRRLSQSVRGLGIRLPQSQEKLRNIIQSVIRKNRHKESVVRVTVTRGEGGYGFHPSLCPQPTLVVTSRPFTAYPKNYHEKGITAALVTLRRNSSLSLPPSIKSTNCLNGILAKRESLKMGAQEGLMLSLDGSLAEGTVSNIFIVKGSTLKTPAAKNNILPGVTRDLVCRLARRAGIPVQEKRLSQKDLLQADEVFITNTSAEVLPVSRVVYWDKKRRILKKMGTGMVGLVTKALAEDVRITVRGRIR